MVSSTSEYKIAGRTERYGTVDASLTGGMLVTDVPVPAPYCKYIVNMDINNVTGTLRPRKGYKYESIALLDIPKPDTDVYEVIYSGELLIDVWNTPEEPTQNNTGVIVKKSTVTQELVNVIIVGYDTINGVDMQVLDSEDSKYYNNIDILVYDKDYNGYKHCINVYDFKAKAYLNCKGIATDYRTSVGLTTKIGCVYVSKFNTIPKSCCMNNSVYYFGVCLDDKDVLRKVYEMDYSRDLMEGLQINNFDEFVVFISSSESEYAEAIRNKVGHLQRPNLRKMHIVKHKNEQDSSYSYFAISPLVKGAELSASESVNYGYNMLLNKPYEIKNVLDYEANTLLLDGVIPKNISTNETILRARVGEPVRFEMIYKTNDSFLQSCNGFRVRWEMTDTTSSGNTVVLRDVFESPVYNTNNRTVYLDTQPSYKTFSIICKVYRESDVQEVLNDSTLVTKEDKYNNLAPLRTIALASFSLTDSVTNNYSELKNFDLTTSSGICEWKERLVVWCPEGAESCIFVSEVGTTNYFPYPNGYDEFPNKVVKCVPYGEQLLVFTTQELYSCTLNKDGLSYSKRLVQRGMNIPSDSTHMITVINNMVSFKTDDKYFLVVPKSNSVTGELQLAPISRQVEYLLENMETCVADIVKRMYSVDNADFTLMNNYTYTDNSIVCYVYSYVLSDKTTGKLINQYAASIDELASLITLDFVLCYDTSNRAWTIRIMRGSPYKRSVFVKSSIDLQTQLFFDRACYEVVDGEPNMSYKMGLYKVSKSDDVYEAIPVFPNKYQFWKNYQYIDTGYRETDAIRKKRFREFQFNINNIGGAQIGMGCGIIIDDIERKMMYNYDVLIKRETNSTVSAVLVPKLNDEVFVNTISNEEGAKNKFPYQDYNEEEILLDLSKTDVATNYKARVKVSGKGYNAKAQLLFKPNSDYELTYTNWVYRSMNQR